MGENVDCANKMQSLERLLDYASALGLHGIVIMTHECKACGTTHRFHMVGNLDGRQRDEVPAMLMRFGRNNRRHEPFRCNGSEDS